MARVFTSLILCLSPLLWLLWLGTGKTYAQSTNQADLQRHWKTAQEAMQRRDYSAAEREYLKLAQLAPMVAETHSNLGLAYYLQKKHDLAAARFEQAVRLNASLYYPHYFLARIRRAQKRFREALSLLQHALTLQPENKEARRELAANYVALKELRRAIEVYQTCLKSDPHDMDVLYYLSLIYMNLTKDAFDRVAELPESPFSSLIVARHYSILAEWSKSGNWAKSARVEFGRSLAAAPHIPEVRVELAQLELKVHDWEAAAELFKAELSQDASSYLTRFGLAQISLQKLDVKETIRYLNQAAKIRPEFFDPLPTFPVSLPREKLAALVSEIRDTIGADSFGGAFLRAVVASELGDIMRETTAREAAKRALAVLRSKVQAAAPAAPSDSEKVKHRGLQLLRQKRYEAGTALLLPLVRKGDATPELPSTVARALLSMKKYDAATQLLEPYAKRHRDNPELHYLLGLSSQSAAEENMQRMVATDPQSYRVRWLMGRAYFARELYDAAAKEFQAALDLQPNNSDLLISLGNVYLRQMKYSEATQCFRRSVEHDPRNALAQLKLGDSLLLDRKAQEAIIHLRAAVDLDSSLVQAHARLGKGLALLGQYEEAVRELELASELDKDGSIHYQLGTFYSKLGRKEKAVAALKKSQELRKQNLKKQQLQVMGTKTGPKKSGRR